MWRWSLIAPMILPFWSVFSTYVEVILKLKHELTILKSILHVCGGDPIISSVFRIYFLYSPRMWRWSLKFALLWRLDDVFSTYVEVIPSNQCWRKNWLRILHVCGGDPITWWTQKISVGYSPRMWRWSQWFNWQRRQERVFSTYVEVIPHSSLKTLPPSSILHVCGGDP